MQVTGSGQSYKFKTDGQEVPAVFGGTAIWKQLDANSWETTNKFNGTVLSVDTTSISADGKTMTVISKGTKPNGEAFEDSATLQRVSGGPGLAGKWKSTAVKVSADQWEITPNGDDGLTLKILDYNASVSVKFDGKDYPVTGPTVPKNYTLSAKKTGARRIDFIEKMDGKEVSSDVFTVSADGKSFTDESVATGTTEKSRAVYEKQ
jgi:hypothetical protein